MNTVGFPGLGLEFSVNRFINVFGFEIAWYAVIIAVGFLLAIIYALVRSKQFGLDSDRVLDVTIVGLIGGIIGARLYYVLFSWDVYKNDLLSIFDIRKGGLAIYGGIIGAVLLGSVMCKIRKVKLLPMLDMTFLGFLIGQSIGRWGNFVNIEAYGSETDSFLRMTSNLFSEAVHPCFLYESIWCLLGFLLLHWYSYRRKFDGEIMLMYMVWYGTGRTFIEGLRTDSLYLGNLRVSQMLSVALVIVALCLLCTIYSKRRRNNDPEYLKLYVLTEESKQMLAAKNTKKDKNAQPMEEEVEAEEAPAEEAVEAEEEEASVWQEETEEAPESTDEAEEV